MSPTAAALLGFAAWTIFLVLALGALRSATAMTTGKKASTFSPGGEDLPGLGRRLTRAHANCYENLPVAAALLLYAVATDATHVTDPLAYWFLGARLAQSLTHIVSASDVAVLVRFGFYIVQILIQIYWLLAFTGVAQ